VTDGLELHSPPDDVDTVHDYIQRVWSTAPELDAMDKLKIETAVVELAANIIAHANGGDAVQGKVSLTVDDERIRCRITDTARASEVDLGDRDMPDELAESGRGIAFIQRLVDVLHYERRDGENVWVIEKRREQAGE
jgi:serine/threonine-protein kinase RsbW